MAEVKVTVGVRHAPLFEATPPPLLSLLQKSLLDDSEQCAVILNETAPFLISK